MTWPGCLGLFLVSVYVLNASHITRKRAAEVSLKRILQGGVGAVSDGKLKQQLTAVTENPNSERRQRDDSSNNVRRDTLRSLSRRHRRNKRQNGLSTCVVFILS